VIYPVDIVIQPLNNWGHGQYDLGDLKGQRKATKKNIGAVFVFGKSEFPQAFSPEMENCHRLKGNL